MKWDESKHPRDEIGRFTTTNITFGLTQQEKYEELFEKYETDYIIEPAPDEVHLPDILVPPPEKSGESIYRAKDLDTGEEFPIVVGSTIHSVLAFAGKGTSQIYHKAKEFASIYKGRVKDWRHVKGVGLIETPEGRHSVELHWSERVGVGHYEFFIKFYYD